MPHIDRRAVQPDANGMSGFIQLGIVKPGQYEFFSVVSLPYIRNHLFDQRTSNAGIAIGKMMNVWMIFVKYRYRCKTKCTSSLRTSDAHQVCSRARPVQCGRSGHSQYTGVINTQSIPQIIVVGMSLNVVLQFFFRNI